MGVDWSKAPEWAKTVIASRDNLRQLYWFECHIGRGKCQPTDGRITSTADNNLPSNWIIMDSRPKPADEWVDGLPEVGAMVEFPSGHGEVVLGPDVNGVLIVERHGDNHGEWVKVASTACKPLRTQAERQRQQIIDRALSKLSEFRESRQVLGELYDAGLLRKSAEEVGREELDKLIASAAGVSVSEFHVKNVTDAILSTCNVTKKGE